MKTIEFLKIGIAGIILFFVTIWAGTYFYQTECLEKCWFMFPLVVTMFIFLIIGIALFIIGVGTFIDKIYKNE